jgi:hypothetical protein
MENNKLIGATIIGVCVFLSIGVVTNAVTDKSTHEHRMELIEEAKALYELNKEVKFDKSYNDVKLFVDSLKLEIEKDLRKSNNNKKK